MKTLIFAAALMLGGAAVAQTLDTKDAVTDPTAAHESHDTITTDTSTDMSVETTKTAAIEEPMPAGATPAVEPASTQTVQPSNANPERDARGIKVISSEAVVPSGFNGIGGAVGGPLETMNAGENYPACTAEITDNCLQAYEKGRSD